MNRISRILWTPTNKSAARLGNRSFFSGSLALLLVAAGLTSLGAGCVNNSAADTITGDSKAITREQYARRVEAIEKMVADGEVSREDADARLGAMRRRFAASRREQGGESRTFTREQYAVAEKKIEAMVAEGKVSQEDADRRLNRMRTAIRSKGDTRTFTREEYASAKERLDAMVADGQVSQEDADRRLARMRLMIVAGRGEGGEVYRDGFKRRIEGAVEAGDLSDEALEGIKKRIEGAVEAGAITREEADALYEKLEKSG